MNGARPRRLPGPPRTTIAIPTRRAVHRIRNGIEVARLDAGPDTLNELADAFDAGGIGGDRLGLDLGLLRLRDDGKLEPDRFVGKLPHQFVVDDQLPLGRVDIAG